VKKAQKGEKATQGVTLPQLRGGKSPHSIGFDSGTLSRVKKGGNTSADRVLEK